MKREDLLDALGDVDARFVQEAEKRRPFPQWLKPLAWCAFFAMALFAVIMPFRHIDLGAGGKAPEPVYGPDYEVPPEDLVYLHYSGALLPLTLDEENPGITAERSVFYDFSVYSDTGIWKWPSGYAEVTDSYVLNNETDQSQTITMMYPFISSLDILSESEGRLPQISLNGETVTPELHAGPITGTIQHPTSDISEVHSFLKYQELLSDGSYYLQAMDDSFSLDIPVTVYSMTDLINETEPYISSASLRFEAKFDPEQTYIFVDGGRMRSFADLENDDATGKFFCERFARNDNAIDQRPWYIIVVGADLESYSIQGYKGSYGNSGGDDPVDGVGCSVEKFQSTLGEMLRMAVADDTEEITAESYTILEEYLDLTLQLAMEQMNDFGIYEPRYRRLTASAYESYGAERVFYAEVEVTIPAGGSVTLEIQRIQDKSYSHDSGDAYDLATTLGSNLTYREQRVSVYGWDWIKIPHLITKQNYDFDPENGITEMTLDLNKPHYWLEISKKN